MKRFPSRITVLVSYNVHDNVWELRLIISENFLELPW